LKAPLATRSKVGFIAGLLLFVVGLSTAAFLASRHSASPDAVPGVDVFYAAGPIGTGTTGLAAVTGGVLKSRTVAPTAVPVNAVTDPAQIASGVVAAVIPAGTILTTDMFPAPQTRIGTLVIPPGKRALALRLEPVPGVAGFAGGGDLVDVYGVTATADPAAARVQLVLQAVQVLNVNGVGLPVAQGQPDGPSLVYLLAVTPSEAERLIFNSEFNKLYFDLVAKGEPPVVTSGAGPAEALKGL
jgi:pilus assembly protein CpaB